MIPFAVTRRRSWLLWGAACPPDVSGCLQLPSLDAACVRLPVAFSDAPFSSWPLLVLFAPRTLDEKVLPRRAIWSIPAATMSRRRRRGRTATHLPHCRLPPPPSRFQVQPAGRPVGPSGSRPARVSISVGVGRPARLDRRLLPAGSGAGIGAVDGRARPASISKKRTLTRTRAAAPGGFRPIWICRESALTAR